MSLELEKSMRIINDLVSFCYFEGAEKFDMSVTLHDDHSVEMQVVSPIESMDPERIEEIRQRLSLPRQHEVEQQYWELSGETEFSGELSLVGAMSDLAEVEYKGGFLRINVRRND